MNEPIKNSTALISNPHLWAPHLDSQPQVSRHPFDQAHCGHRGPSLRSPHTSYFGPFLCTRLLVVPPTLCCPAKVGEMVSLLQHTGVHVCVCVLIVCKCMQSCISLATTVASRLPTPQLLKNGTVQMLTADYRPPLTEVGPHSRPSPCASWGGFLLLPRSALRPALNMGASPIPGRLWLSYQTPD